MSVTLMLRRWWLRLRIHSRSEQIKELNAMLYRWEGSPGELLARVEYLRQRNRQDKARLHPGDNRNAHTLA